MGVWQVVVMDLLKFHLGLPCPTLLRPAGGQSTKWPYGCFRGGPPAGVARLHGKRPAAVFYPFGHPTPYAYVSKDSRVDLNFRLGKWAS
jgi:hypothetical protein